MEFHGSLNKTSMCQRVLEPPHSSVYMKAIDKDVVLKMCTEHFNSMLNRPLSINEDAMNRLSQIECNAMLDVFPTVMETRKAVQQLAKNPGADAIPAAVYKVWVYP